MPRPTLPHAHAERAHLFLRGVPVGAFWLFESSVVIAALEPTEAFAAIREEVGYHSMRLWRKGFLQQNSGDVPERGVVRHTRQRVTVEALAPAAGMAFELRDASGGALHADFVNVVVSPRAGEPPVVVVCRKYAHAAVASLLRPPSRASGDNRPPE
jgi:hypothetical protein